MDSSTQHAGRAANLTAVEAWGAPLSVDDGKAAPLQALRDDQRRLAAIVESSEDAIIGVDLAGTITSWNPAARRLFGYSADEMIGRSILALLPPDRRDEEARILARVCRGERVEPYETVRRRKDGRLVDVSLSVSPIRDHGGRLIGASKIARDITECKAAEAAARQAHEQLREQAAVLELAPVLVRDLESRIVLWTQGAQQLYGFSKQEALGRISHELFQTQFPESERHVDEALRRAGRWEGELVHRKRNGERLVVASQQIVYHDSNGRPLHILEVNADLTARQAAEAELQRREARFRSLIEHASDLIAVLTPEGLLRFQSPSVERVLGYGPAELVGRNAFELVHPEDLPPLRAALGRALGEPLATVSIDYRFRHRNGRFRLLQATARALPADGGGGGEGLLVLNARDVTEQKHLEAQLRQAQKMEALGQLAGGVAHDFNNLLSVIFGHSELLELRLPASEPLRDSVAQIGQAAERAAALTRQLLAFSRQQVLEPQVLDLNALVAGAEHLLRRLIGEDVRLTTTLQPDLWPVRADPGQLDQVLLNLAVNARDAMPQGGALIFETRNLELHPAHAALQPELRPGRYVLLAVTDTGCGMSPEVQARIFEPFFTTKGVGKGTGLGLAVVHGIVEQSGGQLEVCSLPGVGTTFKVYLPAVEAPAQTGAERAPAKPPAGRGETVLLVEDEEAVRAVSVLLLEGLGYRVLEAANAEEALRLVGAGRQKPDLLLTDVVMPGRNGRELAEALRRQDPGLKVLFQSGYTGEAVAGHGIAEGEMAFLQKPFTLDALARKLRAVLDRA